MERHMRDVLEDEVIYDHSQFGLLNSQDDDVSTTPVLMESKHKPRRRRWGKLLRTAALCGAYVSLGLCFSVTGPTLLFLKEQVGTSMSDISYIFTARSLGTLAGAFIGGSILDKCNPYSAFFTIIASMGISIGAMPWFKHLWTLMASSAVVGIANGFLDTGASALCLQLWGKDSGPYMQSLHFAFAVGGSIAPLLVEAFVVETTLPNHTFSSRHVRSITESSIYNSSDVTNTTMASIIQAATQAPGAMVNSTEGNTARVSNVTLTTTLSPSNSANLTTAMLNQTTSATEKPKKPKPSITNGGALGDSSQFENIPLKNEPVLPELPPITTATTTLAAETTSTTLTSTTSIVTTQASNTTSLAVVNVTSANATEFAGESNATSDPNIPASSNQSISTVDELNFANRSEPGNPAGASSTQTILEGNFTNTAFVSSISTTQKAMKVEHVNNTKDYVSLSEKETMTSSAKPVEITVATATTTTSAPSSTTTTASTTTSTTTTGAATSTTTQAPLTTLLPTVLQTTSFVSTTTTTTTESTATKSRGKNRGQQEDVSLAIPTEPSTASLPTTASGEVISKTPNVVVDYLERFGVTRMHMLYTVIAIIVLHSSFAFLFFLCSSAAYTASLNADRHAADRKVRPFRPRTRLMFVSLMFMFYLSYVGAEVVFSQYLATFTLESHSLASTSTANYVTTTYWASFAIGRFAAIFIANFMSPSVMLYSNLGLTILGAIILCAAAQTNVTLLYLGSAFVGFGMAPTFATGFVWTEMHLVVTNRISSVFCIGSSMGEMLFPTVTGSLIEGHPMALMYEVLGSIMLCTVVLWLAGYLANYKSKRGSDSTGYHLACQTDELSQS